MGPRNCHDGKHFNAMMNDFRALLNNTQHKMHHMAIYSGMQEFVKHQSRNKTYISDELLHGMELCIYHDMNVVRWRVLE